MTTPVISVVTKSYLVIPPVIKLWLGDTTGDKSGDSAVLANNPGNRTSRLWQSVSYATGGHRGDPTRLGDAAGDCSAGSLDGGKPWGSDTTRDHNGCDTWLGDATGDHGGDEPRLGATAGDNDGDNTWFGDTAAMTTVTQLYSVDR